MKRNIIAIVGESGSGKTAASFILQEKFGWEAIVSYTTRPMREGETDGKDHWFVAPSRRPARDKICAYTQYGGYEYWTEWEQFQTLFNCVYVVDEKGLVDLTLKESHPLRCNIVKVKIVRDKRGGVAHERMERDKERMVLDDSVYDYVIANDGTIGDFRKNLYKMAEDIIKRQQENGGANK